MDLDGERQVGGHPGDHRQLLGVLLAEIGGRRLEPGKQLRHHGGDALEVAGTVRSLHGLRQGVDRHPGGIARRIHRVVVRGEDDIGAGLLCQGQVAIEVSRVSGQIGGFTELEAVHVEAHQHHIAALPGSLDQGQMPFVEEAHGGHEADAAGPEAPGFVERSGDLHREPSPVPSNCPARPLRAASAPTRRR